MSGIINHIKTKYAASSLPLRLVPPVRLTTPLPLLRRHSIEEPSGEDYYFNWTDGIPQFVHLDKDNL